PPVPSSGLLHAKGPAEGVIRLLRQAPGLIEIGAVWSIACIVLPPDKAGAAITENRARTLRNACPNPAKAAGRHIERLRDLGDFEEAIPIRDRSFDRLLHLVGAAG